MTELATGDDGALGFPEGFIWGASTAAYQIEGAVTADGRGPSVWDTFSHTPGKVRGGDTGDVACDSYHRYREDIALIASLGLRSYRFSISWPRVQPGGRGAANQRGLDYYRALLDALASRASRPPPPSTTGTCRRNCRTRGAGRSAPRPSGSPSTPRSPRRRSATGSPGGSPSTSRRWSRPTGTATATTPRGCATAPPPRPPPTTCCSATGWPPRRCAPRARPRSASPWTCTRSASWATAGPGELERGRLITDAAANGLYLGPVLHGRYPEDAPRALLPPAGLIADGDLETISAPIDFLGVNYYSPIFLRAGDPEDLRRDEQPARCEVPGVVEYLPSELERTNMDWLVDPTGLHQILVEVSRQAPSLRLYVTENGCAAEDYVNPDGEVNDLERVRYLHTHLEAAARAIKDGANLAGYFVWSLLDNFEWGWGYQKRFGIVFVDFGTQRRIPKASAAFYANVVRANAIPLLPAAWPR